DCRFAERPGAVTARPVAAGTWAGAFPQPGAGPDPRRRGACRRRRGHQAGCGGAARRLADRDDRPLRLPRGAQADRRPGRAGAGAGRRPGPGRRVVDRRVHPGAAGARLRRRVRRGCGHRPAGGLAAGRPARRRPRADQPAGPDPRPRRWRAGRPDRRRRLLHLPHLAGRSAGRRHPARRPDAADGQAAVRGRAGPAGPRWRGPRPSAAHRGGRGGAERGTGLRLARARRLPQPAARSRGQPGVLRAAFRPGAGWPGPDDGL
ncbi:MAG: RNA binding methyltransferase FtsJ like, partial [uncultured Friedmanniella sp.]